MRFVTIAALAAAMSVAGHLPASAMTKEQAMRHPVAVVIAVRYVVNLALLTLFLGPKLGADLWRTGRRWLVPLRRRPSRRSLRSRCPARCSVPSSSRPPPGGRMLRSGCRRRRMRGRPRYKN